VKNRFQNLPFKCNLQRYIVDGFSKTYCMTGWRLGWAVMPAPLARKVELLMVHSVVGRCTLNQV
jgi:aspartate aminotransferase